jgi:two-component system, LuxR family, response regulator FixJ
MTGTKEIDSARKKANVLVVDDDEALRTSLVFLLESSGLAASGFGAAEEFLAAVDQIQRPACILLDLRLPGSGGLVLQDEIGRRGLDLPVIVMTAFAEVSLVVRTFRHGAVDFIEKPFSDEVLLDRVLAAVALDRRRYQALLERTALAERFKRLTSREREVLDRAASGMANKCIAYDLGISMKTVECHRSKIMQKLQVGSFGELVQLQCAYTAATGTMQSAAAVLS